MSARNALVLVLGAAAVVLLVGGERRTDEQVVRDACRDLLEVCAERDLHAVWDLQSAEFHERVREVFEAVRSGDEIEGFVLTPSPPDEAFDLADEDLFVRETREFLEDPGPGPAFEPNGWAPWVLPEELLRDLTVEEVVFEEGGATVRLRFERPERDRMTLDPAEFHLVPEGGDWRFLEYEFTWTTSNPPEPGPPDHEVGMTDSGEPMLTVTIRGDRYPPDLAQLIAELPGKPERATIVLQPEVHLPWRRVFGFIAEAAELGIRSFEVSPWSPPPEKTLGFALVDSVYGLYGAMRFRTGRGTMRFELPGEEPDPASVDLIVEPGSGDWSLYGFEEWMVWLAEWDPELVVLFDSHPDLPCGRVTADFDFLERPGVERILLARPAEDPGPVHEEPLLNGRPLSKTCRPPKLEPDDLLPLKSGMHPVPEGHAALGRILR